MGAIASNTDAMAAAQGVTQGATFQLRNPAQGRVSELLNVEKTSKTTDQSSVPKNSKETLRTNEPDAGIIEARRNPRSESVPFPVMTAAELTKAVQEMPYEPKLPKIPTFDVESQPASSLSEAFDRYCKFNHACVMPPAVNKEQLSVYFQTWHGWLEKIQDEVRRKEVGDFLQAKADLIWPNGFDFGVFVTNNEPEETNSPVKKPARRDKNAGILLFDNGIEPQPYMLSKTYKATVKLTIRAFLATGANIDAVNLNIALAENSIVGNQVYEKYAKRLKDGRFCINDWKNATDITADNPDGLDMLIYALFEVQTARDRMKKLKGFLLTFKNAKQKKNTHCRIAEQTARINHWLAIAIELDRARSQDETDESDDSDESDDDDGKDDPVSTKAVNPRDKAAASNLLLVQGEVTSSEVTDDIVSTKTSTADEKDGNTQVERVATKPQKLKVPFGNSNFSAEQAVEGRMPDTPTPLPTTPSKRKVAMDADERDESNEARSDQESIPATKRKKMNDGRHRAATPEKHTPSTTQSTSKYATQSIRALTTAEHKQREKYLLKVFVPKVNKMLKQAGVAHLRTVPADWKIVKDRLEQAGVLPSIRNVLLRDFKHGFQTHLDQQKEQHRTAGSVLRGRYPVMSRGGGPAPPTTPARSMETDEDDDGSEGRDDNDSDDDSDHEIKEENGDDSAVTDKDGDSSSTSSSAPNGVIKFSTWEGFDPSEYCCNTLMILPGFRYKFDPNSTIQDRITYKSHIAAQVAKSVVGNQGNGEWYRVFGKGKLVVRPDLAVVATGYWDEMDGGESRLGRQQGFFDDDA